MRTIRVLVSVVAKRRIQIHMEQDHDPRLYSSPCTLVERERISESMDACLSSRTTCSVQFSSFRWEHTILQHNNSQRVTQYMRYMLSSRANKNGERKFGLYFRWNLETNSINSGNDPQNEFIYFHFSRSPISLVSQKSENAWIHWQTPNRTP